MSRELQAQQRALAAALRDPQASAPAWMPPQRLALYRRLLLNTVDGMLSRAFAVARSLLDAAQWQALVAGFHAQLRSDDPQLRHLPTTFLRWLQNDAEVRMALPPWWTALCAYEQVDFELTAQPFDWPDDAALDDATLTARLLDGPVRLSALAQVFESAWPVHRIDAAFASAHREPPPQPTRLLIWRDRRDAVRFMEIDIATVLLLQAAQGTHSGREQLQALAATLQQPADAVVDAGAQLLSRLYRQQIVLID